MPRFMLLIKILPILSLVLACAFIPGGATPTPTPAGPCLIVSAEPGAIAYTRPSTEAQEFADMANADFPTEVGARTADDWLGFDPHVAQAANIGVFRFRWVQESQVTTEGNCAGVPEVVGPLPDVCYFQPMGDTPVYTLPDNTSAVITTLAAGQYAQILGPNAAGDWVKIDLNVGNTGINQQGWVEESSLNVSGPCDSLPVMTP
jgi:hypothetical protein